jgi:hypothetical protein
MRLDNLPSVLQHPKGSLSMERALKQILRLLPLVEPIDKLMEDEVAASIDDVETMLSKINRD